MIMKKITINLIAFVCIFCACGQLIQSQIINREEIDEFILDKMEIYHVPGLSACIIIGDSIAWNNNYGYMNLEDSIPVSDSTLFNIFSIGKSLTAASVMQLWDKGFLGLDQSINDFLPFQIINPYNGADSITPRMLMSHSAGIKDVYFDSFITIGDPAITLAYFVENYFSEGGEYYKNINFYTSEPGMYYHYSNFGSALNGFLVEPLTDINFSEYAQDSLLEPLEMYNSAWYLNELNIDNLATGYHYSSGNFIPQSHLGHPAYPGVSLRSTALELSNFVIMLLNNGIYKDINILSEAAIDSMKRIQNPNWSGYGTTCLGMYQRDDYGDRIVWGHNGGSAGGYAAHYYFCPAENSGIVITTNSEQYIDPIVQYLFDHAAVITDIPARPENGSFNVNVYPNPAKEQLSIDFKLENESDVIIEICDVSGKRMKPLTEKPYNRGAQHFEVKMQDLPTGIYFLHLQAGNEVVTKKVVKL
jgi:CubicO group peptidase (beta-lactamase class C family)